MTYNRSTGVFNQTITGSTATSSVGPIVYQGKTLAGSNFIPIEGDFNGDGKEDFGVYDFSTATYYIEESSSSGSPNLVVKQYGWAGHDLPLMADFNGDGTTDFAVFRPSTATFYAQLSNGPSFQYAFGWAGHDQPVVGDFNGDGTTDIAVFRPSTAQWFIQSITVTNTGQVQVLGQTSTQFGWPGHDQPAPADYDGDGKTDIAVFRPVGSDAGQTQGKFYVRSSTTGQTSILSVGTSGQVTASAIPVALDFNGDGKADAAVYQPLTSQWSILYSGASTPTSSTLGAPGGLPLGAPLYPYRMPASSTVSAASVGTLTDFQAATSPATTTTSSTTTTSPTTTPTPTINLSQGAVGSARMAQIRRLMLAQQRQAKLHQASLSRHVSPAQATNRLVPGGLLALQNRWRLRGI